MATLGEGLIVAKDWGLTIILPAILVYALVYALLSKTQALGELEWVNITISAILALLFVAVMKAVKFTAKFLPVIAAGMVILFVFILAIKFIGLQEGSLFGVAENTGKLKLGVIVVVGFIAGAAIWAFKKTSPAAYAKIIKPFADLWDTILDPTVMSLVVLFGTLLIAAWYITREVKGGEAAGG